MWVFTKRETGKRTVLLSSSLSRSLFPSLVLSLGAFMPRELNPKC